MELSLAILKTGETLISQTEQLDYEPKVHLERPYLVGGKTKVTLTPWPEHSGDKHILLHSDSLLTVCEPSDTVKELYLKKINKKAEDFLPKEQEDEPVLLNENEQLPSEEYEDDHGYQPRYEEI
jgi:hypothetical protein